MVLYHSMIEDIIYKDYIAALKARDKHKVDFLSFVRADLKNCAIDLKKEKLDDNEALIVLKKQKKRIRDSKENIVSSGRSDLIQNIDKELAILDQYLPKSLGENELIQVVETVIVETDASSMKDMGKVMKEILAKIGAAVDTKRVSEIVKEKLSSR